METVSFIARFDDVKVGRARFPQAVGSGNESSFQRGCQHAATISRAGHCGIRLTLVNLRPSPHDATGGGASPGCFPPPSSIGVGGFGGELDTAIARGVAYLCRTQNSDGSWDSPRWVGGVDKDPVPVYFNRSA